jgi:ERCC4-type nuclease
LIWMDSREPQSIKLRVSAALAGDAQAVRLSDGDYLIFDNDGCTVAVERKTATDLLGSLADGRLARQLTRLKDGYIPVLLIEGILLMDPDGKVRTATFKTGWSHASVQGYLWSLLEQGVRVMFTAGMVETVDALRILHNRGLTKCLRTGQVLGRRGQVAG